MKTLLIAVFVAFVHSSHSADLKNLEEIVQKCQKEIGFNGTIKDISSEGAPKEAKCFLKCLMENKEVLKKDGTLDKDLAHAYTEEMKIPPPVKEKLLKVIDECIAEAKPDPDDLCETAYKYFQCKRKKAAA